MSAPLEIHPLAGIPEIDAGCDLGALLAAAARRARLTLEGGDIVVVAQKAVSKAEGRTAELSMVEPGGRARALARELGKDPRLVELILAESASVLRAERGVLIVETHGGWICANAGIDSSNVPGDERVTLLPEDADASARRLRAALGAAAKARPAVVVADSFGRPWRLGQVDVAIGCAGLAPIDDWRGRADRGGRELEATAVAIADEVAAAADLSRDKAAGVPAAVVRGLARHVLPGGGPGARALRRERERDLFR